MNYSPNESTISTAEKKEIKKSLVSVYFPERCATYSYYNDAFDLKKDDLVFVEGRLEGIRGIVVKVSYTFKIKLSDYKRVIAKCDTDIKGKFFIDSNYLITTDRNSIPFSKIKNWFYPPEAEECEYVSGCDEDNFNIFNLSNADFMINVRFSGEEYFDLGKVKYIEILNGHGRAIVHGTKYYTVEFNYNDGKITGLVCDCFCNFNCKHEYAVMITLQKLLNSFKDKNWAIDANDYFAAIRDDSLLSHKNNGIISFE